MNLTVFPSYYEPWSYAPRESLALGVPTITTDYAGFGHWAQKQEIGPETGLTVLSRLRLEYPTVVESLAEELETRPDRHDRRQDDLPRPLHRRARRHARLRHPRAPGPRAVGRGVAQRAGRVGVNRSRPRIAGMR